MEYSHTTCQLQSLTPLHYKPVPSSTFPMPVADSDAETDKTLWKLYERWVTHCQMHKSVEEKKKRFPTFKENVMYIISENKTNKFPYKLEVNKYSDMTNDEYESTHDVKGWRHLEISESDVASEKTLHRLYKVWMSRYMVTRSPNEKLRRFRTFRENVEYIHSDNKREGRLYKIGLTRFADITVKEFDTANMSTCASGVINMYSKMTDKETYRSREEEDAPEMRIDGYKMVAYGDEEAMEEAVSKQAVVRVLLDCRGDAFKNYRGGVLTEEFGKEGGYAATVFGYGVTPSGVKFWEIVCSFGPEWGEGGYLRLKRGVNLCGVASFVTYPNLKPIASLACAPKDEDEPCNA